MKVVSTDGARIRPRRVEREKVIYKLLLRNPELLESRSQLRLLSTNKGPEKGPDFVAVNRRGQLVLGEIKIGPLRRSAWGQIKSYAKRFGRMREDKLEEYLVETGGQYKSLKEVGLHFLSRKAKVALRYPSRRRLQLVLVAEAFSDRILAVMSRKTLGKQLRGLVKDVKCIEMQEFDLGGGRHIVAASIVAGRARWLRR